MSHADLSPRQTRFVQAYCGHLNASRAAREAGYSASSGADAVTGYRLLRNAKARRAIEARQQAKAAEMRLDRNAIIQAILGAIQTAQEQGAPATMVRGWVEIAKITGLDKPETPDQRRNVPLSAGAERVKTRFEAMSTNELLELLAKNEQPKTIMD
jgi:phage terminase small subunit